MTSKPDPKPDAAATPKTGESSANRDASAMRLILSMADTTWRMFTPPAIVVPAGLWADLKFGTKPWLTLLAAAIGLGLSVLLIKKQLGGGQ